MGGKIVALTVLSSDAEIIHSPLDFHTIFVTAELCPIKELRHVPEFISHIIIVRSSEVEAKYLPLGL